MLSVVMLAAATTATPTQCPQNRRSDYAAAYSWTTYKVQPGDTPASVAKKFYGQESEAYVILSVNKSKLNLDGMTFKAGETLVIPPHGKPWKYDVEKYRNWHDW
jgi:nucleoid-associated protein YgaU